LSHLTLRPKQRYVLYCQDFARKLLVPKDLLQVGKKVMCPQPACLLAIRAIEAKMGEAEFGTDPAYRRQNRLTPGNIYFLYFGMGDTFVQ
jgi:hypothetical protein